MRSYSSARRCSGTGSGSMMGGAAAMRSWVLAIHSAFCATNAAISFSLTCRGALTVTLPSGGETRMRVYFTGLRVTV